MSKISKRMKAVSTRVEAEKKCLEVGGRTVVAKARESKRKKKKKAQDGKKEKEMRMEETKKSKEAAQKEAKVSEKTQAKCEENAKEESKKRTLAFQAAVQIRNAPQSPADFSPRRIPSPNQNPAVENPPQSYIEQQQRGSLPDTLLAIC